MPGNHDAALVRPWVRARDGSLGVDTPIPLDATPALARLTSWLEPARVRVSYPGVWLADRVWATHGHYLDRHLLPEAAYGVARGLLGRLPRDGATPADYEGRPVGDARRGAADPLAAAPAGGAGRRAGRAAARRHDAGQPAARCSAAASRRSPSARSARRCAARASPRWRGWSHRLGVDADWVVFGHVHRCGPLAGDVLRQWRGPGGVPRIANTGSWVYEPVLLHRVAPPHPYWPGGAIRLAEGGEPRGDRPARPPRRRRASPLELEHDLAGRAALVDEPCSASRRVARAGSARRRSGSTKPASIRRSISAPISRLSSGLPIT